MPGSTSAAAGVGCAKASGRRTGRLLRMICSPAPGALAGSIRSASVLSAAFLLLVSQALARAQQPPVDGGFRSASGTGDGGPRPFGSAGWAAPPPATAPPPRRPLRHLRRDAGWEFNIVPIAGGDSDVGIGVEVARSGRVLHPDRPFRWKLSEVFHYLQQAQRLSSSPLFTRFHLRSPI